MADRSHDIVLFGATGFTGALTAEYLAQHAPPQTRWALAGRNRQKLDSVRARLPGDHGELPLLEADTNDPASLQAVAESTKVVITTVGPYINYGEPVVAACAAAGTHYVDLTGEPEFVDQMWLRYHQQAEQTGARIVHSCGFDSIPYDLGALYTVERLPESLPIKLTGMMRAGGTISGGTYHTIVQNMARLRHSQRAAGERRKREQRPANRRVHGGALRPHHDSETGWWLLPFLSIDAPTVLRSARALDRYGPDFRFELYFAAKRLPALAGVGVALGAIAVGAQLPPTRNLLLKLKGPGEGPSPEQRENSWFKVRFVGEANGARIVTEVSGGDPGYGETSKMLSEAALCLAHDQLPDRAGQLTPAVAMGDALIDRLQRAGMKFAQLEP